MDPSTDVKFSLHMCRYSRLRNKKVGDEVLAAAGGVRIEHHRLVDIPTAILESMHDVWIQKNHVNRVFKRSLEAESSAVTSVLCQFLRSVVYWLVSVERFPRYGVCRPFLQKVIGG
jgi:hypothetical protein